MSQYQYLLPPALYTAFAAAAVAELYFFMMQRSSLEISRAADIDSYEGRYMLPFWYFWVWPVRLVKWGTALAIAIAIHWGLALVLLAIPLIISLVIPIPHGHFIGLFRRKVRDHLARGDHPDFFNMLDDVLNDAEEALSSQWTERS